MALTKPTRVMCLGDFRLRHLQPLLNENQRNIRFYCHVYSGATLGHLLYHMRTLLHYQSITRMDEAVNIGPVIAGYLMGAIPTMTQSWSGHVKF